MGIILICSCSSQKNTLSNRALQNLSAKYNYIYNSNILLNSYQEELYKNNKDNYKDFLAVYISPNAIDYLNSSLIVGELEDIANKAKSIITEKKLSNYTDEAYILLGKTNFYSGNYFNAVAYFDYTAKTFKNTKKTYLTALNWKARSLIKMNDSISAIKVLDTIKTYIESAKANRTDPLVTLAQMSIYKHKYKEAISYLKRAIKETNQAQSRIRWNYILAQLYEYEKEYKLSLINYTKVENSNAPFEMYFNAKLSKIRINDLLKDGASNRREQLIKLLKDDKNLDYNDQIYYEVAEDYYTDNNFDKALIYYQLSAQKSTINQFQKGLTYLKIAELNFKDLRDYTNAKLYYDSANSTLPNNYPNYEAIVKKGQNLEFLTERYQLISKEDTLQSIAKLNEQERFKRIDLMFEAKKEITPININTNGKLIDNETINSTSKQNNGTFYFNNIGTISIGFSDFKKKWGNRTLADNWRQSVKSSSQINQQNQNNALNNTSDTANNTVAHLETGKEELIKKYAALLPLTLEKLTKSNQLIINAYFEIAGFYQQVLNDQQEAIKIYELLLELYPQNNHLETIYYSLYLNYKSINETKANNYKNIVLNKYPNSIFAKTILDPNFSLKENALEVELNKLYNKTFETYVEKDFLKIINSVEEINQRFPNNNLQAQYDYLKAISIGRTQNVDNLLTAFNKIITQYPDDILINPLVKTHIAYINANLKSFKERKIALLDFDSLEPPFIEKQVVNSIVKDVFTIKTDTVKENKLNEKAINTASTKLNNIIPEKKIDIKNEKLSSELAIIKPTRNTKEIIDTLKNKTIQTGVNNIFSLAESKTYFYVIAIADASLNVSSSRFGIGQFNRVNFASENLKHQLIELVEEQLIYVGNFSTLQEVKLYSGGISAILPKIMKIPSATYMSFYISKENFNKLKDKETLTKYLEFFKNNYNIK